MSCITLLLVARQTALSSLKGRCRRHCTTKPPKFLFQTTQIPLVETFRHFLQQIENHGEGSISLCPIPDTKVVDVVISNPNKRNCLSGRMIFQLMTIIDSLSADQRYADTVAVLLRGEGSDYRTARDEISRSSAAFCAGLDFSLAKQVVNTPAQGALMCAMMTAALNRLRCLDIVSVALVHGPALGGGAELATACDFRLMTDSPSSKIGFVHGRLGASPGWGGGARLVQIVGRSRALRMLGTAQVLGPSDALDVSLVDAVLPAEHPSSYLQQSMSFLQPFTDMPFPRAVKDLKGLVAGLSAAEGGAEARELEQRVFGRRWGSEDNLAALRDK